MKTFMPVALMCMLASANAEVLDSALSASESLTYSRASTYPDRFTTPYEGNVLTETDGYAYVTALTEGEDATAAGTARSSGSADGYNDVGAALSERFSFAMGLKDDEVALAYSDSEAVTATEADPNGFAMAVSGMGIRGWSPLEPLLEPQQNEGGALASLITAPYPHQAATYSRSEGESTSNGDRETSDTYTNTEQVAVIDITFIPGMFADALADSRAFAEAEYFSTG
jgi:hypothetical protein